VNDILEDAFGRDAAVGAADGRRVGFLGIGGTGNIAHFLNGIFSTIDHGQDALIFLAVNFTLNVIEQIREKGLIFEMNIVLFGEVFGDARHPGRHNDKPGFGKLCQNIPGQGLL